MSVPTRVLSRTIEEEIFHDIPETFFVPQLLIGLIQKYRDDLSAKEAQQLGAQIVKSILIAQSDRIRWMKFTQLIHLNTTVASSIYADTLMLMAMSRRSKYLNDTALTAPVLAKASAVTYIKIMCDNKYASCRYQNSSTLSWVRITVA